MKTRVIQVFVLLTVLICAAGAVFGEPTHRIDLSGVWKFQTDPTDSGRKLGWQMPEHDYSTWKTINVPGSWESQGFKDANRAWKDDDLMEPYSGYAWYQKSVSIPADWKGEALYLNLGRIDDMDWTYFNGVPVGQTTTTAQASSAIRRSYLVPQSAIKFGKENVITVRVLDMRGSGGIVEGPVSVTTNEPDSDDIASRGRKGSEKVEFGSSIVVGENETVSDAVAMLGSVTVRGHVTGDAVAVMGNVTVMPGGRVDGDAVAVGGKVVKQADSFIGGDTQSVGFFGFHAWDKFDLGRWGAFPLFGLLASLVQGLLFMILAVLTIALFPARTQMVADAVLDRPGPSMLYGVVAGVLILPIALVLLMSCVGIPLIAVEALFVVVAWIFARIAVSLAVGRKVGDALNRPIASSILAAALGVLILTLVDLVPFAGPLAVFVLTLISFGAVILTGFGSHQDWFTNRRNRAAAHTPSVPTEQQGPPL